MADDDFDSADPAPLPAYDRVWRHPAEHVDAERSRHLSTAPPVGRRLLMLTAVVSVLASGSLLFVVVPKGISEYTSGDGDDTATIAIKGAGITRMSHPAVVRVSSSVGESTAVCLGNGRFLVPLHMVDSDGTVQVVHGSDTVVAGVVRRYTTNELAVVRTSARMTGIGSVASASIVNPENAAGIDGHAVVDAWSAIEIFPERSIVTRDAAGDVPIATVDPVHGVGVVVDSAGTAIGIVVRRQHSSWILSRSWVQRLLSGGS